MKKLYLALAVAPVPIGILTHYMRPINMAPRLVSEGNVLHFAWKVYLKFYLLCYLHKNKNGVQFHSFFIEAYIEISLGCTLIFFTLEHLS